MQTLQMFNAVQTYEVACALLSDCDQLLIQVFLQALQLYLWDCNNAGILPSQLEILSMGQTYFEPSSFGTYEGGHAPHRLVCSVAHGNEERECYRLLLANLPG